MIMISLRRILIFVVCIAILEFVALINDLANNLYQQIWISDNFSFFFALIFVSLVISLLITVFFPFKDSKG